MRGACASWIERARVMPACCLEVNTIIKLTFIEPFALSWLASTVRL